MTSFLAKMRIFLGILGVFTLSSEAVFAAETKQTIHVGIYAPFSTKSAYIGRNMLGAMEIARDQLKSSEISYEFHTLDVVADHEKAATTLQKFIEVHHINILVTEGADSGSVVAPLAQKNDLIHFCLTADEVNTDGKNNFLAKRSNHQRGALLSSTAKPEFVAQFKQEYFSQPVTEAGYAYDIFHLLNNSAVLAMKTNSDFSSKAVAHNLLALETGTGLMGRFQLNKKGLSYKKATLTA